MALDTNIVGSNLDAGGNVKVALSQTPEYTGGVRLFSENDDGTATGTALLASPETSQDYRLRVGLDTVLFTDTFNATAQNTNNWSYSFGTLTAAQPGTGTVNFSAVQGTTSSHGAFMRTFQFFPMIGTAPLAVEFTFGMFTAALVTNETWLCGLGLPTGAVTPPTDGVWFQLTSAGLIGVIAYNGSQTQTGVLKAFGTFTVGDLYKSVITVGEQEVEFWLDDVLLGSLSIPAANGQPFINGSLPAFMHKYNTGNVSNTNTMRVSDVTISLMDINNTKQYNVANCIAGMSGFVGQNGQTQGRTQAWTNNTAAIPGVLTNTNGLQLSFGGTAAINPTLTANNDGIVFSYANPSSGINATGRNLVINGVKVQGVVTTVLAGGPVIYQYFIAFGHLSAALTQTETGSFANNTTHAPRIAFVGMETYATTAAVATLGGPGCVLTLTNPIVVRPGEIVQLIARNIGTVTTTGVITVGCTFDAYWD